MANSIITRILNREEFRTQPPVLIDIGASGGYHKRWKAIAPYAYCLAFDADDRKLDYVEKENSFFKKQFVLNSLVFPEKKEAVDFYLTRSPQCSSTLPPDAAALKDWAYASYFDVEKKVSLPAMVLTEAMAKAGLNYVDWFKTDSQGIDLALFKSLPENIRNAATVVEMEPGIIDAYSGENKMYEILAFFNKAPFWLADIVIKGFPRMPGAYLAGGKTMMKKLFIFSQRTSPGWGEMLFLNTMKNNPTLRQLLLGWIVGTIEKQHGYALEIAKLGQATYKDPIFTELAAYSARQMQLNIFRLGFMPFLTKKIKTILGAEQ